MATIKAYTDLSQSKALSKILPLESADMYYTLIDQGLYLEVKQGIEPSKDDIPCWSLAALLSVLGYYTLQTVSEDKRVIVVSENGNPISSNSYPQPVDACVDMIIKLNELNLL